MAEFNYEREEDFRYEGNRYETWSCWEILTQKL